MSKNKKLVSVCALMLALVMCLTACGGGTQQSSTPTSSASASSAPASSAPASSAPESTEPEAFTPAKTVNIIANAKAGTNIDIHARTVMETLKSIDEFAATGANVLVTNQEDGNGAVAQRNVAGLAAGEEADNTLLTLNVGDLAAMLENTDMTVDSFKILGVTVQDKHMIYVRADSPFQTFNDIVEAVKTQKLVIAGGKGDEVMFGSMVKAVIDQNGNLNYLQTSGNNDTAVQVLGGHVDVGIGKPSVLNAYMESGDVRTIAVEGDVRFDGLYADVPTLVELGYGDISYIQCRAFCASPNMSDAAIQYWSDMLAKVCDSDYFVENYVIKNQSSLGYMDAATATEYFLSAQENTLAVLG